MENLIFCVPIDNPTLGVIQGVGSLVIMANWDEFL